MSPSSANVDSASVQIVTQPPSILPIPNQTVTEGTPFPPLTLDQYIQHPFYPDSVFRWSIRGTRALTAVINNRVLTVTTPNASWNGQENLTLIVTDPNGTKDSTVVTFHMVSVDDPPVFIKPIGDLAFPEDGSLVIPLDSLRVKVSDPDDDVRTLHFVISENQWITWALDTVNQSIRLSALPDWNGRERILWTVRDPSGLAATDTSWVTVVPVQDPPQSFDLIDPLLVTALAWPDTIRFVWRSTTVENALDILYVWRLRDNEKLWGESSTTDTALVWVNPGLPNGVFYWSVFAYIPTGLNRESRTTGIIQIQPNAVGSGTVIPAEFGLLQNYPNPFNPETRIEYHLPKSCQVSITIMNTLGQGIAVLADGWEQAGIHVAVWNGADRNGLKASAGIYFCRFIAGGNVFNKKMLLIE
jgi:hypothetical protein